MIAADCLCCYLRVLLYACSPYLFVTLLKSEATLFASFRNEEASLEKSLRDGSMYWEPGSNPFLTDENIITV